MSVHSTGEIIIVRGGGDLATGVVQKFHRAGFKVLILETSAPTAIRRSVALCEAVYDGTATVEDIICKKISTVDEAKACWEEKIIPLLVDPEGKTIWEIKPAGVIDAIIAKRNLGTTRNMADVTVALGPGFNAGEDVHAVIETMRGHDLGRLILQGSALPDTGIPGEIAGESIRRVLHAPEEGIIKHIKQIGSIVEQGEPLFTINYTKPNENDRDTIPDTPSAITTVKAPIRGLLRGLIREGIHVNTGTKVADIDSRTDIDWRTISDKARCLGGAALEAYFYIYQRNGENA